jgi:hypothetical protein
LKKDSSAVELRPDVDAYLLARLASEPVDRCVENLIILNALRIHKSASILISLLITTIIIAIVILFFLKNQFPSTHDSGSPQRLAADAAATGTQPSQPFQPLEADTTVKKIQPQVPLRDTKKAIEDADRKILENANTIENMK